MRGEYEEERREQETYTHMERRSHLALQTEHMEMIDTIKGTGEEKREGSIYNEQRVHRKDKRRQNDREIIL